jgi:hypothetical protein
MVGFTTGSRGKLPGKNVKREEEIIVIIIITNFKAGIHTSIKNSSTMA